MHTRVIVGGALDQCRSRRTTYASCLKPKPHNAMCCFGCRDFRRGPITTYHDNVPEVIGVTCAAHLGCGDALDPTQELLPLPPKEAEHRCFEAVQIPNGPCVFGLSRSKAVRSRPPRQDGSERTGRFVPRTVIPVLAIRALGLFETID